METKRRYKVDYDNNIIRFIDGLHYCYFPSKSSNIPNVLTLYLRKQYKTTGNCYNVIVELWKQDGRQDYLYKKAVGNCISELNFGGNIILFYQFLEKLKYCGYIKI